MGKIMNNIENVSHISEVDYFHTFYRGALVICAVLLLYFLHRKLQLETKRLELKEGKISLDRKLDRVYKQQKLLLEYKQLDLEREEKERKCTTEVNKTNI
eukprot:TRINITY_DN1081_c1_g1_i1.p1 TRINITY_DN1081_c1_g1~~TRINITY_DN1081_c1_g1_i1.p1  ORF type:complete len:100 (-),score=10.94 TRINITY_DN1081_c1_g1_i1:230-529(-)